MKVAIEVKNRREAEAVRSAMEHKETRALVLVLGHLLRLKSDRARARVLNFVYDSLDEQNGTEGNRR